MIRVGNDFIHGVGTAVDYAQAMQWFQKASTAGSDEATALVGSMYYYGYGVPQAAALYTAAAVQHNALAEYRLGLLYQAGTGPPQDYVEAFEWYYEAAKYHEPGAEAALGNLYNLGLGVKADQSKAYAWTALAAKSGNKVALQKLQLMQGPLDSSRESERGSVGDGGSGTSGGRK